MFKTHWLALAVGAIALAPWAQAQDSPFLGNWTVTWEGKKQAYEARLQLGAQGGTWKTSSREKNNPCVGREVPVKIDATTADQAQLTLAFSEAIPGCKDSKVLLKAGPGGITGTRGEFELTLKRD